LRQKLGEENFRKIKKERFDAGSRLMRDFELARVAFSGDKQQSYAHIPHEVGIMHDEALDIIDQEIRIDQ
jgi:hypothetical protein